MSRDPYYITTAIDYPNGAPHLGHAYEKVVADFYARHHRLVGRDVRFLTGTDENGQKLQAGARERGMDTGEYVDGNVALFRDLCARLGTSHDDFIRTTEPRHREGVHAMWRKLAEGGFIYPGDYTGRYCGECESFYTESQLDGGLVCPHHGSKLPLRTEKGYFFRMGGFADWIVSFVEENPGFIAPEGPRREVLSRLKGEPLRDLSISRPNEGWGTPVPGDDAYVVYTWFDALINYHSALGSSLAGTHWPASCHVIGRDIVWFHSVIWPCMLRAAGLPPPRRIYVHGMVLDAEGRKMSKSLGNGIDPNLMLDRHGADAFRFYLLRHLPAHSDGCFSEDGLVDCRNNSLADDYGNLLMRVVKIAIRRVGPRVAHEEGFGSEFDLAGVRDGVAREVARHAHDRALEVLWGGVQEVNRYINRTEPWAIKDDDRSLREILFNCLRALHALTRLLHAAMPAAAGEALSVIGASLDRDPSDSPEGLAYGLREPPVLFPKTKGPDA